VSGVPALVIGIAGGSGAGKSTIAGRLASAFPDDALATLEYDAYYRDRPDLDAAARAEVNYDHPNSLDTGLLLEHLAALRRGDTVQRPVYDFLTHRRSHETRDVGPAPIVIVEGILLFVDARVRAELDICLFVDTDPDIRAFRRVRRDMESRGRTFDSVRKQYYATVRPMHLEFVEPSKRWADLIIPEGNGGDLTIALDVIIERMRSAIA
jgi:uridine kinase